MSNQRTATPQGKTDRTLPVMVTAVLLALIILAVPILSAVLQAPIISPVYGCTAKIESNKPGTIGGTSQFSSCLTGAVLASGSDVGAVFNTGISLMPTVVNPQTGRTVPYGTILVYNGIFNGTSTIKLFDDWFVNIQGFNPTCLTMQNVNTINDCVIDIESTTGVVQCLKNGVVTDGGGVLGLRNLSFRTKTNITAPLGGGGTGAVVQCGTPTNNVAYSQLYLQNLGCKSDAIQSACVDIETVGADDYTEQSGVLFGSCFTYHTCITINAWDYVGLGTIQTSTTAILNSVQADSYAFKAVAQGSFQQNSLSMAGTYNGVFVVAGNPGITTCGNVVGCVANFHFINFGTSVPLSTYTAPPTGYRVFINAPTSIFQYTTSGGNNNDMFSNSTANPGIFYNLNIQHSSTAKNYQFIPNCFSNFAINAGNTNFAFGAYYTMGSGGVTAPVSGRLYTLLGTRLGNLTISGGTAVVINIKDPNGYTYVTGATTLSNISPQVGSQLTVTFSGAPTVKCWLEPVV